MIAGLSMEQRCRSEVHFIAHVLRESVHAEGQLHVPLRIDRNKGDFPAVPVGPDDYVGPIGPFRECGCFRPNGVSYFGSGFKRLHHRTRTAGPTDSRFESPSEKFHSQSFIDQGRKSTWLKQR